MSLDDLLAPVKWADEQILRQYSKITLKWEETTGTSRYILSNLINIPSLILTAYINNPYHLGFFHGWNLGADNVTKPYGRDFNIKQNYSTAEDGNPWFRIVDRATRLPLFTTGIGFTGFGLYEVVSGFWNGNNHKVSEGLTYLSHGLPFIGVASSQYVKDADPKLLDKEAFWKQAYDSVKEIFLPKPQPVPVENYNPILREHKNI